MSYATLEHTWVGGDYGWYGQSLETKSVFLLHPWNIKPIAFT